MRGWPGVPTDTARPRQGTSPFELSPAPDRRAVDFFFGCLETRLPNRAFILKISSRMADLCVRVGSIPIPGNRE